MTPGRVAVLAASLASPLAWLGLLFWPVFSVSSFHLLRMLKRQLIYPRTIIDVGANVGQFTVAAAKTFPGSQIYSFEPSPSTVEILRRNVRRFQNVELFAIALAESPGVRSFNINQKGHSSSLLALTSSHAQAFPDAQVIGQENIIVERLDDVMEGRSLVRPVLLKLDVQGAESLVLDGAKASLRGIDYILTETSFRELYAGEVLFPDLLQKLSGMGFDFLRPLSWLEDPRTGEIVQGDMLFVNRNREFNCES